ncbi:MAG: hypothetical protein ACRDJE_05915 [Dehalococcoidia bacterium]
MITPVLRWAGTTRTLSLGTLVLTTLISYGFLGFAVLQGWPLWLVALVAAWHGVEHAYIMSVFLRTGTPGTPGLLSEGGMLAGGLPLSRADLHFLYNLVETVPLLIAFAIELRRGLMMRTGGGCGTKLIPSRPRA